MLKLGRKRGPAKMVAVCLAALLLLGGCAVIGGSVSDAPQEVGEGQVGMEVFSDPTGSTILMVPVFFGDAGPFQFVLDTGASRTVLEPGLIDELGLSLGSDAPGTGIGGGEFNASTVRVESWRLGDVQLQPRTVVTTDLPSVPAQGPQFRGLLGSDVLSGFGVIEIDYNQQILTLQGQE
ncbi:hypothetical protein BH23ACT12_BH23ACT12_16630 [soil metagenome]